jgi:hypothetical protein
MSRMIVSVVVALGLLGGCYRTRVVTGLPPSGIHHVHLSHTFIGGLIGGETQAGCQPAVVETRLGLLGLLAAIVTVNPK